MSACKWPSRSAAHHAPNTCTSSHSVCLHCFPALASQFLQYGFPLHHKYIPNLPCFPRNVLHFLFFRGSGLFRWLCWSTTSSFSTSSRRLSAILLGRKLHLCFNTTISCSLRGAAAIRAVLRQFRFKQQVVP